MERIFCLVILFLSFHFFVKSQARFTPDGGGELSMQQQSNCLSTLDYQRIETDIQFHVDSLRLEGINFYSQSESIVLLDWPLKKAVGFNWNSFYRITNFIDHDTTVALQDYHCDQRTYDGHRGTDIALWPFSWHMVNNDLAEVVAAADGVIVQKYDGENDDHCSWGLPGGWNAVFIKHTDGSTAWYGHLKKNSVTTKPIGQAVVKGEYLGIVASSGVSTGPHLHFEIRDSNNAVIDPWGGTCNTWNAGCFVNQKANREPTMNALLTHDTVPVHGCPSMNEFPYFQNTFFPGDTIHCAAYYHDQLLGDTTYFRLRRPDNTVYQSWQHGAPNTYTSSWWRWRRLLPNTEPYGVWTLEADYKGLTQIHTFNYGVFPTGINEVNKRPDLAIYPNPTASKSIIKFIPSHSAHYKIYVYNVLGKRIETLLDAEVKKSNKIQVLQFNKGKNSAGLYFIGLYQNGVLVGQESLMLQ